MIVTDDLEDAATKAVHVAEIVRQAQEVNLNVTFSWAHDIIYLLIRDINFLPTVLSYK